MQLSVKSTNRFRFRVAIICLIYMMVIMAFIAVMTGKEVDKFADIAMGVGTFAGIAWAADYWTSPTEDIRNERDSSNMPDK